METHSEPFEPPLTLEQLRARSRRGARICRAVALVFLVGALFAVEHVMPQFTEGVESLRWTRTEGVLLDAGRGWKQVILDDGEGHESWLVLRYAYDVPTASGGPRSLTGGRYDVSTSTTGGKHEHSMTTIGMARACLADAPRIAVYYDPADPARSVVSPGIPYGTGGWIILVTSLFVVALWLLRAARALGRYDSRTAAEREFTAECEAPVDPEVPGGVYVKDEHGEYWRGDDDPTGANAAARADTTPSPPDLVEVTAAHTASAREAGVLTAVLMGVFVPVGGFALMASLAFLWEKWVGGVPPTEIVLGYCAFVLAVAAAPRLAKNKVVGSGVALCAFGIPLLGAVAVAFVFYEDMTDSDVRDIDYVRAEETLADQMRSPNPVVRETAVRAAGRRRELGSLEPLIAELCHDADEDVRDAARAAAYRRNVSWRRDK